MGRILALDYGLARIGLAISDERKIIASSYPFIENKKKVNDIIDQIKRSAPSAIERIVIGLPLFLDGKESPMCLEVRKFSEHLAKAFDVPITFWDERLTSAQVEKMLKSAEVSRKKRTKIIDSLAAVVILQNYLDAHERRLDT